MLATRSGALRAASLALLAVSLAMGASPRVLAQLAEPTYEASRVAAALASASLVEAEAPQGKVIAYLRYERREVFEGNDLLVPVVLPRFAPTWPNRFHWLTEESTVRREVLLREGEPFDQKLADESMRNLRELGIFSLVSIVAVETDDPSRVGVVIYTRDLWSLRLEQGFSGAGSTFSLGVSLVERNFLGRNKTLSASFDLGPFTYQVGQAYLDPRMFGGELRLYEAFDVIVNRATGETEGSLGTLLWGRPYYNLAQQLSFDVLAQYAVFVSRATSSGEVIGFDTRPGPSYGDDCAPTATGCVAQVWDDRRVKLEAAVHHRTGQRYKQTFSLGLGFRDRAVAANAETALAADERAAYASSVLPRVRRETYPFVRYRLTLPTFATFTNLGTYGQTESVLVGPRIDTRLAVPVQALGSTRDGLVTQALMAYVWSEHDALIELAVEGWSRLDGSDVVDERGRLQLRAASPSYRWLLGRMVARGVWDVRRHDTQNTLVALGGDSGLRGYPSQYFYGFGASQWLANLEYRTRPWRLQSVHLGLVAFYDAGSVYARVKRARLHHALGAGLRVLFPHFNRHAFRLDFGTPLDSGGFAVSLSYGTAQVVPLTPEEDLLAEDVAAR